MKPKRCTFPVPDGFGNACRCVLERGHAERHTLIETSGMDYAPDEELGAAHPSRARWRCNECGRETSHILTNVTVTLDDGTREGQMLAVCASCLGVRSTLERLCDADGCPNLSSSGTPTKDGYVFACHRHAPPPEKEIP